jgi:hypothetical protein
MSNEGYKGGDTTAEALTALDNESIKDDELRDLLREVDKNEVVKTELFYAFNQINVWWKAVGFLEPKDRENLKVALKELFDSVQKGNKDDIREKAKKVADILDN